MTTIEQSTPSHGQNMIRNLIVMIRTRLGTRHSDRNEHQIRNPERLPAPVARDMHGSIATGRTRMDHTRLPHRPFTM